MSFDAHFCVGLHRILELINCISVAIPAACGVIGVQMSVGLQRTLMRGQEVAPAGTVVMNGIVRTKAT